MEPMAACIKNLCNRRSRRIRETNDRKTRDIRKTDKRRTDCERAAKESRPAKLKDQLAYQ
jgi:hypothetical protein